MDPILSTCPDLAIIQQMLAVIIIVLFVFCYILKLPRWLSQPANAGDTGDVGSIPDWEDP